MDEHALRELISDVKAGRLSRRAFVQTMVGLGLTAPLAAQMLASAGVAQAQPKAPAASRRPGAAAAGRSRRSGGRRPTLLNPHFATGTKDQDASRIFYEPLAGFDPDGNIVPDPGRRGAERAERRRSPRTSRRSPGSSRRACTWHDGKPFTADDVVFNWEYVADPATPR